MSDTSPTPVSRHFPLALKLDGRACLLIGSSAEAARRARALLESGARVTLVAPSPSDELRAFASERGVPLHERGYRADDLSGVWLAVLTDRDEALAARVAEDAERARVFFCAVDMPEYGSFSHMALARAGIVTLAIGTEGQAPALGRRLREELERVLDQANLADFARALAELRARTPRGERLEVLGRAVAHVRFEGQLRLEKEENDGEGSK